MLLDPILLGFLTSECVFLSCDWNVCLYGREIEIKIKEKKTFSVLLSSYKNTRGHLGEQVENYGSTSHR